MAVGRVGVERQRHAVRPDRADQRGAAHPHLADRQRGEIGGADADRGVGVGQRALVDDLDAPRARRMHERAVGRRIGVRHHWTPLALRAVPPRGSNSRLGRPGALT
jgi:hypothetical protein